MPTFKEFFGGEKKEKPKEYNQGDVGFWVCKLIQNNFFVGSSGQDCKITGQKVRNGEMEFDIQIPLLRIKDGTEIQETFETKFTLANVGSSDDIMVAHYTYDEKEETQFEEARKRIGFSVSEKLSSGIREIISKIEGREVDTMQIKNGKLLVTFKKTEEDTEQTKDNQEIIDEVFEKNKRNYPLVTEALEKGIQPPAGIDILKFDDLNEWENRLSDAKNDLEGKLNSTLANNKVRNFVDFYLQLKSKAMQEHYKIVGKQQFGVEFEKLINKEIDKTTEPEKEKAPVEKVREKLEQLKKFEPGFRAIVDDLEKKLSVEFGEEKKNEVAKKSTFLYAGLYNGDKIEGVTASTQEIRNSRGEEMVEIWRQIVAVAIKMWDQEKMNKLQAEKDEIDRRRGELRTKLNNIADKIAELETKLKEPQWAIAQDTYDTDTTKLDQENREGFQDLKIIDGIGPRIEKVLNSAGIKTYDDLAGTSVDELKRILDEAGPAYSTHDPSAWSAQALLAANNEWESLKAYQEFLDGFKKDSQTELKIEPEKTNNASMTQEISLIPTKRNDWENMNIEITFEDFLENYTRVFGGTLGLKESDLNDFTVEQKTKNIRGLIGFISGDISAYDTIKKYGFAFPQEIIKEKGAEKLIREQIQHWSHVIKKYVVLPKEMEQSK